MLTDDRLSDVASYPSRQCARDAAASYRGWDAVTPVRLHLPTHPDADSTGHLWILRVRKGTTILYERDEGYVR